jgi:hypothetical protein
MQMESHTQPSSVHSLPAPVYAQFSAFHCHTRSTNTYQSHTDVRHFKGAVVHVLSHRADLLLSYAAPYFRHIPAISSNRPFNTTQSEVKTPLNVHTQRQEKYSGRNQHSPACPGEQHLH